MSTNFAEQWLTQYKHSTNPVSYQAFDFDGIKRVLIEYLQVYHPEYFNNLIETDELLPLIELFAYVGDLYSYRADINTQEHILTNATRKSSVLQLASMLGYKPSRRTPAMGLVKIVSVQTTETVIDGAGNNLRGKIIKWNDPTNPNWQIQFTRILNKVLNSQIGTLSSKDKIDLAGAQVERYGMNAVNQQDGVYRFSVSVNNTTLPMEVVSAELTKDSIIEQPPTGARPLSVLSVNDGFGPGSSGSGFFFLVKQGTIASQPLVFDGNTINITQELAASGINETDLWLAEVDSFGNVINQWDQVDNIAYDQSPVKTTYQIETLEDDRVRLVFGDGSYSAIPNGRFACWYRVSESFDGTISPSALVSQKLAIDYFDSTGNIQTITLEVSLTSPIISSGASETIDKIKRAAPGVFYTQDRMVNGRDYQEFLLQDPSIIKTKAVNRTFAGQSKYSGWYDGSEVYENVKIFGTDGILYLAPDVRTKEIVNPGNTISAIAFVDQHLEPILDYPDVWLGVATRIGTTPSIRKFFNQAEKAAISAAVNLSVLQYGATVKLIWNQSTESWEVSSSPTAAFDIGVSRMSGNVLGWAISINVSRSVFSSKTTKFWDYRTGSTIDYDTLFPTKDRITVLQANANTDRTGILPSNIEYAVVQNYIAQSALPNQGEANLNAVEVVGIDIDGDKFPEDFASSTLIGKQIRTTVGASGIISVPLVDSFIVGDVIAVHTEAGVSISFTEPGSGVISTIQVDSSLTGTTVVVHIRPYVYFEKNASGEFEPIVESITAKNEIVAGNPQFARMIGRSGLNFLWQHFTQSFQLVDPAKTNIVDIYLITKQFFSDFMNWLSNPAATIDLMPPPPDYKDLQLAYSKYLGKGMLSDEIVLRPGRFKPIFGSKSRPELRAKIQLIVQTKTSAHQTIKAEVVQLIREYFDLGRQDFGQTFFFSDLSRYVSSNSRHQIASMLLVPLYPGFEFGDLYQLRPAPNELLVPDISTVDIEIVENITRTSIRQ
jgi:hypothetical protein